MTTEDVIEALRDLGSGHHRDQYKRFGIEAPEAFGVKSPDLQKLAKSIGRDHNLAIELFDQPIHEAKLISAFLADPNLLSAETMDHWVSEVYSWDLCDNLCMHLIRRSPLAEEMAYQWVIDNREYVRRCGLVVMTSLSIHNKKASNDALLNFTKAAIPFVTDERNFVRKAISWLLRTQGKRNLALRAAILKKCDEITAFHPKTRSAKWIVNDVRRELMKRDLIERMKNREVPHEPYST